MEKFYNNSIQKNNFIVRTNFIGSTVASTKTTPLSPLFHLLLKKKAHHFLTLFLKFSIFVHIVILMMLPQYCKANNEPNFETAFNYKACSCLDNDMQLTVCKTDFVILGKFRPSRRSEKTIGEVSFHSISVKIIRRIKGDARQFSKRRHVTILISRYNCAPRNVSPLFQSNRRKRVAVFMGFRIHGKNVVSRCGMLKSIESLSETQAVGLFLGGYNRGCHVPGCYTNTPQNIRPDFIHRGLNDNTCVYNPAFRNCYELFTLCKNENGSCKLLFESRWEDKDKSRRVFRKFLRHSEDRWRSESNGRGRFTICVSFIAERTRRLENFYGK